MSRRTNTQVSARIIGGGWGGYVESSGGRGREGLQHSSFTCTTFKWIAKRYTLLNYCPRPSTPHAIVSIGTISRVIWIQWAYWSQSAGDDRTLDCVIHLLHRPGLHVCCHGAECCCRSGARGRRAACFLTRKLHVGIWVLGNRNRPHQSTIIFMHY